MSQSSAPGPMLSRRDFVASAAAAATAAALPQAAARAATPARYRRMNASAPGFPSRILDSYRKAIRALQTTFCGVFRSRTSRSNRARSAPPIEIRSIFLIGADSQVRADL